MSGSESSENPNRPEAPKKVYGINDTDDEIRDHVNSHVHRSESRQGKGLLGKLFGKHITTIKYGGKEIVEETRPPSIFRHEGPEPILPEGRFRTDRKGRMHRIK